MNFNVIENEKKKQEQDTPQMSIGQQLEIMSKVKEIEYQNSLVMKSLEQYNSKYEQLKKEQNKLLEKIEEKINQLQTSNDQLRGSINQEVSTLTGRANKVLHQFKGVLDREFNANMEKVGDETKKTIAELEDIKSKAKERFTSYYNRKKWIDYVIFGYMAATPILFVIVIWILIKG